VLATLLPLLAYAYLSTGPTWDRAWYWQNPVPQGNDLRAQSWVSSATGWAVGTSGVVLKSVDGGAAWQPQYADTQLELTGVSFVSSSTGWVAGLSGVVRKTIDGGATWITQNSGTSANYRAASFANSNAGVLVGDRGATYSTIRYTTDGGATWASGTTTATVALTSVDMVSASVGWAVGGSGVILKTTDGGATWIRQASPTSSGLNSVSFEPGGAVGHVVGTVASPNWTAYKTTNGGATWTAVTGLGTTGAVTLYAVHSLDASTAVMAGSSGTVRRTNDGGSTWLNQDQTSLAGTSLRAVQLINGLVAQSVGDIGTMIHTQDGGTLWESQVQGTAATLYATTFADSLTGWTVGSSGTILKTDDSGATWLAQASGTAVLRALRFVDTSRGWVVGDAGTIKATTDGGATWATQTTTSTAQLNGVWFTDSAKGWAVGNSGTMLVTTDSGATWTVRSLGTTRHLYGIWFADANNGYVVGQSGAIYRTTNGGATWVASTSGTTQSIYAVHGVSATNVWAVGNAGTVIRTTNGGTSAWTNLTAASGTTQALYAVHFTDATHGWLSGANGTLRTTTNAGTSWTLQNAGVPTSGINISLRGLAFTDSSTGYAVGTSGVIRKTDDAGARWFSLQQGTTLRINAVEMAADGVNGWAAAYSGIVMRTRDGGQTWFQEKTGAATNLLALDMVDSSRGWVAGASGTVRRTTDGGATWVVQTSGTANQINGISSVDGTTAVLVGVSGMIKRTTDSGATWTTATTVPTTANFNAVQMASPLVGYAVANTSAAGSTFKTTDGGITWVAQPTAPAVNMQAVSFLDANRGWIVGINATAWTTDGGATWTRVTPPLNRTLYGVSFADSQNGWAVGSAGSIFRSIDGGQSWVTQESGTQTRILRAVNFTGVYQGWIVGDGGTILATTDQTDPTTALTVYPTAPDGDNGWYVNPATVTLTPSKPGITYYSWVASSGPFSTYSVPLASLEGSRTLYYHSSDTAGRVEPVNAYPLRTDTIPPTAATGTTATAVTTSTVSLSWAAGSDSGSGILGYDVYVDGVYSTGTSGTSITLSGLTPNTPYAITVAAFDRAGNRSAVSVPLFAATNAIDTSPLTTIASVLPSAPDGANGWYVTTPTVALAWLPMADLGTTYYSWTAASGPYSAYVATLTPPPGVSTLHFSTHAADINRTDEPTRTLDLRVDTSTVSPPTISASPSSYQSVLVTWAPVSAPPSGIERYDVFVDGVFALSATGASATVTGLSASTAYSIKVTAHSGAGVASALSAAVAVTTPAAPRPSAPTAVMAKAPSAGSVYMNWLPSTDATGSIGYHVWRSTDGVAYSVIATTTGLYECSYIDGGRASSTRYWYAVSTFDDRGEGSLSNTSSATWAYTAPITTRPDRVLGVEGSGLNNTAYLTWQAPTNPAVVGYYVRRGTASLSTMTTITAIPATTAAYFDLTAQNGQAYYYQVAAVDASGVVGTPSIDLKVSPIAPYPANQPHPHEFGNESGCICHGTHSSATLRPLVRFPGAEKNTVCRTCHAPVNSYGEFTDPLAKSKHPMGATQSIAEPYTCTTCHTPLVRAGAPLSNLMRVNSSSPCVVVTDTPAGNGFCYSCHGPASTLPMGDLTVFETSGHRTIAAPTTGANITCDSCHDSHSSRNSSLLKYEGFMVCVQCHTSSATNPAQVDILGKLMLNEGSNTKHPLLPQDQTTGARMSCQNCHNTHTTSKDFPLVDPHNPSPSGTWTTPRSDEKAFCFRCHNGQPLPTSVETTPWANAVFARSALTTTSDIQARYAVNVHGFASASGSTTTTAHLRPDMGYAYGDVLECRACHDPHGTANNNAILDTVVSANGSKKISGVLTYRIPSGGKDFRFFCNTCHLWDSASHDSRAGTSTVGFPMNCKACHGHSVGTPPGAGF